MIKNILLIQSNILLLLTTIFVAPVVQAGGSTQSELDEFVSWMARVEISALSPKILMEQLEQKQIPAKQSYLDKRYLFLRAFPEFTDSIVKLRFQATGKQPPKAQWVMLDAYLYFPDLLLADVQQLEDNLAQSLGDAAKHSNNNIIKTKTWKLDEFIEFSMRVDIEAGNVTFSYAVLQGDSPF